jgi:hypothetical protein
VVNTGNIKARGRTDQTEIETQAFRLADPVALHSAHLVGPAVQAVQCRQQLVGVLADLEEPLRQLALLDLGAGAPAAAVDHLLVGEHGHVDGIPVHLGLLALDQAGFHEIDEHALLVLVVGRVAGREFTRPVQRQAHRLQLLLHRSDVLVGPRFGVHLVGHRGIFRRHAEGVPPHRVQHVLALRALEARHHVAHRVVAHVTHMDAARRIREHLQHVVLFAGVVVLGGEDRPVVPQALPTRFGLAGIVAFVDHRIRQSVPGLKAGD